MKKTYVTIILLLIFTFIAVGCSNTKNDIATTTNKSTTVESTTSGSTSTDKVFTLEELATFNGKDGTSAYVAYKGIVYDVTDVPQWNNGKHNGFEAGIDATDVIDQSPHGEKVFKTLTVVGTLK